MGITAKLKLNPLQCSFELQCLDTCFEQVLQPSSLSYRKVDEVDEARGQVLFVILRASLYKCFAQGQGKWL